MKVNPQLGVLAFGVGLAAGAIYLIKTLFDGAKEKIDSALDTVTVPIAAAIVGPSAQVRDGFVLPGGRTVTFKQLIDSGGKVSGDQTLTWQGVKYRLTVRNPDGWYLAERA